MLGDGFRYKDIICIRTAAFKKRTISALFVMAFRDEKGGSGLTILPSCETPLSGHNNHIMSKSRAAQAIRLAALLLAPILSSCGTQIRIPTPLPPEFASGISYTNHFVPEVPWSIHVV